MTNDIWKQVQDHLEARWKYLGEHNQQGTITKKEYFNANRSFVYNKIFKFGLRPDGKGGYIHD